MDIVDKKLMKELSNNGRQSYIDLATKLGVVEGTVRKRLKRLLDKDILKVLGIPNVNKLGYGLIVIMGLQVRMADLREVANKLAAQPTVCYLTFVTGRYDLMAVIIAKSAEEISHFIEKEISAIPSILRTETFVNLEIIKGEGAFLDIAGLIDNFVASSS